MSSQNSVDLIGSCAAILSVIEVGLGSLLHAFRIPFTGQFLSLNQGFILGTAQRGLGTAGGERTLPFTVSAVASLAKSISPAGKKLGPMLAISMQGFLFNVGTFVFGINILGTVIGMVLLSMWAFIQPLFIYYLLFGASSLQMVEFFYRKLIEYTPFHREHLIWFACLIVGFKVASGILVAFLVYLLPLRTVEKYQNFLFSLGQKALARKGNASVPQRSAFKATLYDLTRPLFLFSMAITFIYVWYVEHSWSRTIWLLLRPLAIGFLLFYFSRVFPVRWLLKRCEGTRFESFSRALYHAMGKVRRECP